MGLFDRLRKKEKLAEEEKKPESIWDIAYQAVPQGYRKDDGEPFIVLTLTEDTPTILPMDPKRMIGIDGKPLEDFRLSLFSLSEDKVVDTLPFYSCINILSGYVQELREPYVLIRALTHDDLVQIQNDVRSNMFQRQKLQEKFEKNLEFIALNDTSKETVDRVFREGETIAFSNILFPTGKLTVLDPLSALAYSGYSYVLKTGIPAGKYDVLLSIIHPEDDTVRIAGMKLLVSEKESVRYEFSPLYAEDDENKALAGVPVDAGSAAFCDGETLKAWQAFYQEWLKENPEGNFYNDYLMAFFQESYEKNPSLQREGGDFIRYRIPDTEYEIVISATGYGDGMYSVFTGYDENDEVTDLVVMFINPDLF